jgi:hypothetical protein
LELDQRHPRFSPGSKTQGAAMWELVALLSAVVLIPAIVLGLFRLAGLKRLEDLQPRQ